MPLHIIAVGKKHESWVAEGIERYQKRLKAPFLVEWAFLPHSAYDGPKARQDESERILSKLGGYDFIILLDERGREMDSVRVSDILKEQLDQSRKIAVIIGGAYGVTDALREYVDLVWSLSSLVFPHQLVRLILTEQVYRVQQIAQGGAYHHE